MVGAGQSLNVGQPRVSCEATGEPKLTKFWTGAVAPLGPSISAQSGSAYSTPYGCHGRPQ